MPGVHHPEADIGVHFLPDSDRRVKGRDAGGDTVAIVLVEIPVHGRNAVILAEAILDAGPDGVRTRDIGHGSGEVFPLRQKIRLNPRSVAANVEEAVDVRRVRIPRRRERNLLLARQIDDAEVDDVGGEARIKQQFRRLNARPLGLADVVVGRSAAGSGNLGVIRRLRQAAQLMSLEFLNAIPGAREFVLGRNLPGDSQRSLLDVLILDRARAVLVEHAGGRIIGALVA